MSTSTHDEHQQIVKDCEKRESKLTDWERGFIDSISKQMAEGRRRSRPVPGISHHQTRTHNEHEPRRAA